MSRHLSVLPTSNISPELFDEIMEIARHPRGARGRMEDLEREVGATVVPVGAKRPFSFLSSDWDSSSLITVLGNEVRIIAIMASHPGSGAFRRLIQNIEDAGLIPVVIEPMMETMPAILKKWGWKRTDHGTGFNHEEQWRPE